MPVKTVISPSSAPQVTFRQATRGVSNENGLCQARHMARGYMATCHPLPLTRYPSPATRHPPPVTRHPPPVTRHPSPVTRHPSPVTRHPSPATRHPRKSPAAARYLSLGSFHTETHRYTPLLLRIKIILVKFLLKITSLKSTK